MNNNQPTVTPDPKGTATPVGNENGNGSPATPATPVTPGQGQQPAGQVILSTEQYRQLERDAARGRSQKRREEKNRGVSANNGNDDGQDPEKSELINRATAAEREALQLKVKDRVRSLLEKPEYSALPKATRELILKNPAALSEADNLDDALIDIEEFLDQQATEARAEGAGQGGDGGAPAKKGEPAGVETPPRVNSAVPAPATPAGLEDTSGLHGPALSRAKIRNAIKKKQQGLS